MLRIDIGSVGLLRFMLTCTHLAVAAVAFLRPHMVEIIPSYYKFGAIAGTTTWGWVALVIGLGLLLTPKSWPLLLLWQFGSATVFSLFSILVTGSVGVTWGTVVYAILAISSGGVAYLTADAWFARTRWPQRFRGWVDRKRGRHG